MEASTSLSEVQEKGAKEINGEEENLDEKQSSSISNSTADESISEEIVEEETTSLESETSLTVEDLEVKNESKKKETEANEQHKERINYTGKDTRQEKFNKSEVEVKDDFQGYSDPDTFTDDDEDGEDKNQVKSDSEESSSTTTEDEEKQKDDNEEPSLTTDIKEEKKGDKEKKTSNNLEIVKKETVYLTLPTVNKTILTESVFSNENLSKLSKTAQTNQFISTNNFEEDPTMPCIEAFQCPQGILHDLAEPDFNMWKLNRDSMIDHIEYIYHDLGIAEAWKIPRTTLRMFLLAVRERYQDNPYHNFKHCFCVTQMAYSILCKLRLRNLIPVDQIGALITAAVCHDVDHPGLNNSYHSHARTPLAILYNYQSILEQHHFAVTCRILSNKERNIFRNVSNRDEILTNIGELILATDLSRHKMISEDYNHCISVGFDFENSEHVMSLMRIIIKCADVSNEVRPETVAGPWVERLFAEYYEQSAREKREHLPVTPYMDPELVNVSQSQESFIRGMMLPIFSQLEKLSSEATVYYINPLYETLLRYEMQNLRKTQK